MSIKENIALNPTMGKINDTLYKAKPTICVAIGIVGTGVSVYLAWRAGRKAEEIITANKAEIAEVKAKRPKEVTDAPTGKVTYIVEPGQLDKPEYNRALLKVHMTAAIRFGKLIAPAVFAEVGSIMMIGYGYGVLNERFIETAEACQAYAAFLTAYRERVRDAVGEDKERQLYYGLKEETVDEPDLDKNGDAKLDKNGKIKTKKTKKDILAEELAKHSMYARIFDADSSSQFEINANGEENLCYNGKFIKDSQRMFNNTIRYSKNHIITLNDIYEHFGFTLASYGQVMGWHCKINADKEPVFDMGDSEGIKFVVFPVWYKDDETSVMKRSYIIDFNVAGNILPYYEE